MRKLNPKVLIGGSVILSLVIGAVAYNVLIKKKPRPQVTNKVIQVVVAKKSLKANEVLTNDNLDMKYLPASKGGAFMITSKEEVLGRTLKTAVAEGKEISADNLNAIGVKAKSATFRGTIPEDKCAMSVVVERANFVNGFVKPGYFVDILVTGSSRSGSFSNLVLSNIQILAVGNQDMNSNAIIANAKDGVGGNTMVVTLALTVGDARKLRAASTMGKISFVLRPEENRIYDSVNAVPPPKPPVVPKAPVQRRKIEIIRGAKINSAAGMQQAPQPAQTAPAKPSVPEETEKPKQAAQTDDKTEKTEGQEQI